MSPFDVPTVTLAELPDDATILDVREPHEWAAGHIDGAVHLPMNSVPATVADHPEAIPTRRLHVICAMGGRSAQVTGWLVGRGFDAVNIAGGMQAWTDAGRPVVSDGDHQAHDG